MNRYFVRSRYMDLIPGPWKEVDAKRYLKYTGKPDKSLVSRGVEGAVVFPDCHNAFKNVMPELYKLILEPSPFGAATNGKHNA